MASEQLRLAPERLPLREIEKADLAQAYRLWLAIRGERAMPARSDLRPEDLAFCLGRVNLIEVRRDPLDFVFRVRGTTIADMHRTDMTGRSVRDMQPPAYRDMLWRHYTEALETAAPHLYRIHQAGPGVSNHYDRLTLPLGRDGRLVDQLLTVSAWDPGFHREAHDLGFREDR